MRAPGADLYTLESLEQVRALADPFRVQLVAAFAQGPRTTKQVADSMGVSPTKFYRHVAILEAAGLLKRTHSAQKRGTVEQYFVAVARHLAVDPTLFEGDEHDEVLARFRETIGQSLDSAASEMLRTLRAQQECAPATEPLQMVVSRFATRLSPERLSELTERLRAWIDEARYESDDGVPYACFLSLYPVAPPPSRDGAGKVSP
jgi:predicted ArsR family transcriptional regulator